MSNKVSHAEVVDAWLKSVGPQVRPEAILQVFDRAFQALGERAQPVLGEITLGAIAERVLWNVVGRYPFLSSLTIEKSRISCAVPADGLRTLDANALTEGLRFTLIEFLRVIGSLTGEILTPPLRAALLKVPESESAGDAPRKDGHDV